MRQKGKKSMGKNSERKRSRVMVLWACMCCLLLLGCEPPKYGYRPGEQGYWYVTTVMYAQMPSHRSADQPPKLIETDSYGRELWCFADCYVVYQAHDDTEKAEAVWFYEDWCFLIGEPDPPNEEEVERLKERNDWEQPLQKEKMSARYRWRYSGKRAHVEAAEGMRKVLPKEDFVYSLQIDEDREGKQLFYYVYNQEDGINVSSYFLIWENEYRFDVEKSVMRVENWDYQEALHEFKLRNDWCFGEW